MAGSVISSLAFAAAWTRVQSSDDSFGFRKDVQIILDQLNQSLQVRIKLDSDLLMLGIDSGTCADLPVDWLALSAFEWGPVPSR